MDRVTEGRLLPAQWDVPALVVLLTFLVCYAWFIQEPDPMVRGPAWDWNVNSRLGLTFALVQEGRTSIDSFQQGVQRGIHLAALWSITFHPCRGLFLQSPILLLALPGFLRIPHTFWREGAVVLYSMAALLLLNAGYYMGWGGSSFGPRHLIPMLPFLAIPLVFYNRGRLMAGLLWGLSIVQMLLMLTAVTAHFMRSA